MAFCKFGHVKHVSKISQKSILARGLKLGQLIGGNGYITRLTF